VRKSQIEQIEKRITLCQEFTQLWAEFFGFFSDNFEGRKITGEDEARFFRIMTTIARKMFYCAYTIQSGFPKSEDVLALLGETVSLTNLHNMSDAQFGKIQHQWHIIYIRLNKCLGRLVEQRPVPKAKKGEVAKAQTTEEVVQSMAAAQPKTLLVDPQPGESENAGS